MPGIDRQSDRLSKETWQQVEAYAQQFEQAWRDAVMPNAPNIDEFLPHEEPLRLLVLKELVHIDMQRRRMAGKTIPNEDYFKRYPELAGMLTKTTVAHEAPPAPVVGPPQLPQSIGGYRVLSFLGKGAFGIVYLAQDEQLSRPVAVKVPRRDLVARAQDAEAYLAEARTVAGLDHPNIVPIYHSGSTAEHPFFIVSKYIEGGTLAQHIKQKPFALVNAAKLVRKVAEALHYAHRKGLVHRDIKPANILLEWDRGSENPPIPYVADFGLALKEEDVGQGPRFAGTPAYMSPEQARAEGHRVDGRSDIFSLGIVFYELLAGRRPFHGPTEDELLHQITSMEARPLRQMADTPKELERICLKCLAKLASERYLTAADLADDLAHFLDSEKVIAKPASEAAEERVSTPRLPPPPTISTPLSASRPITIVPKGLRSFDAHDADFFLELVPGPRGRDNVPEGIRFWKTKIEERDADSTFAVGLIYGPSGCGKSSLVKAGLLPQLHADVNAVYIEATADETETRLLNGLRKRCPHVPANQNLKEVLTTLRRGLGSAAGKKVLIVLDQFEQWLHAKGASEERGAELIEALRQCDGSRVQCIIMVRDDFWLAVSRFLKKLEVRLAEGQNSALVDLFDMEHAKKVLAALGRAYGKLPDTSASMTKEQSQFLDQAVADLAQDGKIICVHVALFAEMMKGKPWTPATLRAVGGSTGVGVTFLEETFSATTAPPQHRYHQAAARSVLKALAPESGTDIKGHMKSHQELLTASGYDKRPQDFEELIHILDSEVRLITPTDPEGDMETRASDTEKRHEGGNASAGLSPLDGGGSASRFYQLTHDHLVHSLRDWLTRKQKERMRGRAELLLADRAALWNARPEKRQLPTLLQWLQIHALTSNAKWKPPERKMMTKATGYFVVRGLMVTAILGLMGAAGWEVNGQVRAHMLHERLLKSSATNVTVIVKEMAPFSRWLEPLLRESYAQAHDDPEDMDSRKQELHAGLALVSLGLVPLNSEPGRYVYKQLFTAGPEEVIAIREALLESKQDLATELWQYVKEPTINQDERLRAYCALAAFVPDDERWQEALGDVAETLVIQKKLEIPQWTAALKDFGRMLTPRLAIFLEDGKRSSLERSSIALVYGKFAAYNPEEYGRLEHLLVDTSNSGQNPSVDAITALAKKQARIGVALVVMDRGTRVWPLLKHPPARPDPTLRSFLIEGFGPGGVDFKALASRFNTEKDIGVKQAILLSLGAFGSEQNFVRRLKETYRDDPDPGIHGAADALLRQWQTPEELEGLNTGLQTAEPKGLRRWYINRQNQTMMIVRKPATFLMGEGNERRQWRIDRAFAIGSTEVTLEQFQRCDSTYQNKKETPSRKCPVNGVTWYQAAKYCNWLSRMENIPDTEWCYVRNNKGEFAAGMKLADGYLRKKGYRLPTEAEWECACRGGSQTKYGFGEADELADQYAWHLGNAGGTTHPVGQRKPNAWGLFDMHGNVWEWTLNDSRNHVSAGSEAVIDDAEEAEGMREINNSTQRGIRGGSIANYPSNTRSANFTTHSPAASDRTWGFRVARTIYAE